MNIKVIPYKDAIEFLLPRHYSGRKPIISVAYGWFKGNDIMAVCTFGKPASNSLCKGIAGDKWSSNVYELNRLCRLDHLEHQLSEFVAGCLKLLKERDWIIVSYADSGMDHNGYIYQACNFMYTGATKRRTEKYTKGNKHSRHYKNEEQTGMRKIRTSKHRYVFFCASSKRIKKLWIKDMNYPICPYPKGKNSNYVLGEYQEPILVPDKTKGVK